MGTFIGCGSGSATVACLRCPATGRAGKRGTCPLGENEELEQLGVDLDVQCHGQVRPPTEPEQVVGLNVVDVEELIAE